MALDTSERQALEALVSVSLKHGDANMAMYHVECFARMRGEYDELRQVAKQHFIGPELRTVLQQIDTIEIDHDPLLKQGRILGAEIKLCASRSIASATVEQRSQSTEIAGDVELLRMAVGLKQSPLIRLWLVMLQIARESGKNYLSRGEIRAALLRFHIKYSERNLRRWLGDGHDLYWRMTSDYKRVYFIGYERLSKRLTKLSLESGLNDLVSTNRPGQRRYMYVDVAGDKAIQFEGNVYAAWLASKENPSIARSTLAALFNRDPRALREWDKVAGVQPLENTAQYHPDFSNDVPEHGYVYVAVQNGKPENRWRAQMVNTYHTPVIRQHDKRGQSRRVGRVVRELLESIEPAGNCGQDEADSSVASGGLQPTGRLYFSDRKKAQNSAKVKGKKSRFVRLGSQSRHSTIWDYSPDGRQYTELKERSTLYTHRQHTGRSTPITAKEVLCA